MARELPLGAIPALFFTPNMKLEPTPLAGHLVATALYILWRVFLRVPYPSQSSVWIEMPARAVVREEEQEEKGQDASKEDQKEPPVAACAPAGAVAVEPAVAGEKQEVAAVTETADVKQGAPVNTTVSELMFNLSFIKA